MYLRQESGGRTTQPLGEFLKIFAKITILMPYRITFRTILEPFEKPEFLRFEGQLKN